MKYPDRNPWSPALGADTVQICTVVLVPFCRDYEGFRCICECQGVMVSIDMQRDWAGWWLG